MPAASCGYQGAPTKEVGATLLISYGPNLRVDVGFDRKWVWGPRHKKPPKPGIAQIDALVDTGAQESCIDNLLAGQLQLPMIDRRKVGGVTGVDEVNVHLGQICVPSLRFVIYGSFCALPLKESGLLYQVLLGRTFLNHCSMHYDGKTGSVTIAT